MKSVAVFAKVQVVPEELLTYFPELLCLIFRAYGSSALDPVTGKSLVLNLSRNNDLPLAMETLVKLSEYPVLENALLHSDRGVL